MGSTVLEERDIVYGVEFRFRPGGPAVLGVWAKAETADAKFTEWLGSYGRDEAVLTLTATSNGVASPVKSWTAKDGLRVAGAA
ncbi:hypothetical protein ACFQ9J_26985 [Streptomyces sp. NPDC056529]|uniref:hypothetical protein n=1 Tax=Streptomyces sp. NPDC056529 TaxID=3345855 RepID=UPI0036ADE53C